MIHTPRRWVVELNGLPSDWNRDRITTYPVDVHPLPPCGKIHFCQLQCLFTRLAIVRINIPLTTIQTGFKKVNFVHPIRLTLRLFSSHPNQNDYHNYFDKYTLDSQWDDGRIETTLCTTSTMINTAN